MPVSNRRQSKLMLACATALAISAATSASAQYPAPRYTGSATAPASQAIPREHIALVESAGGLLSGPLAVYVSHVGARVATAAGRPDCTFHLLNTDVVNAFTSPPGCHVYVTRGLVMLVNSEDELASALGHEVGHVAANHAGRREQRSILTGLGAQILGALARSPNLAQLASQAGQLNVLSYSRQQEFEADQLGVRYLGAAGYSPSGLVEMLTALQREDEFDNLRRGRQAQESASWARTHPLTSDRVTRAAQAAQAAGPSYPGGGDLRGRDAYLRQIDGMLYGDDPRQGIVDGARFTHPDLRIGFEAPAGFAITNGSTAVSIEGPGGARGQFSVGRMSNSLEQYAADVMRQTVGQAAANGGQPQRIRIGGFDAVVLSARAQTSARSLVDVTVAAYTDGSGQAYHFVTLAPAGRGAMWDPLIGSLRRLSPREVTEATSRRIQVVTVRPGDSVQSLSQRMAVSDYRLERFLVINGLEPGDSVRPGERVKLVVADAGRP